MSSPNPDRKARAAADPVEDMRRQLARLGIEVAPQEPDRRDQRRDSAAREPVRRVREHRAGADVRGIRSGAGDPQRAHPTGFTEGDNPPDSAARNGDDHEEWGSGARRPRSARRGRRSARRAEDSLSAGVGGDNGGQVDPVAAGSQPGEPDRRAGTRRLAPGERPGATVDQAKDAALGLLSVRARSRAELEKRLGEKGFRHEVTAAALDRLTEVGLVDDTAFAEQWVYERHTYSGRGRKALQRELRDKGVAPADAEPALASVTAEAEHTRATDLVRRKLATLSRDLDRDKAVRRLVGMLARRGYDQSTAFAVVTAELADAGFVRAPTPSHRPATAETVDSDEYGTGGERTAPLRRHGSAHGATTGPTATTIDAPESGTPARHPRPRPTPGDAETAADLVRRKLRTMPTDLDRTKVTRRLVDMLARRGYDPGTAYSVVKAELAEADR